MANIYTAKVQSQVYESMERYLVGQSSALTNYNVGSRVRTLLEAVSIVIADSQFDFWQAMRSAIPISAIEGFGFTKLSGTQATGKLVFFRGTNAASTYTIPVDTRVVLGEFEYATTLSGTIASGNTESAEIDAECTTVGLSDVPIGAINTENGLGSILTSPQGIQFARNDTAFSGGTEEESDADRLTRFNEFVQNLARCTVNGIVAGAKTVNGVRSASLREQYPALGWNTIYADDGQGALDADVKIECQRVIDGDVNDPTNYWGYRAAGIFAQILAPSLVAQNIVLTATVSDLATSTDASLQSAIGTALDNYVNVLKIGEDIIFTELVAAVQNSHVDIYDVVFTTPTVNVNVGVASVARTGTVTVTINRIVTPT